MIELTTQILLIKLPEKLKLTKKNVGILVCGSGMGMSIAANRHKNIRAAQCFNLKSTKLSRLHNDANVITLGSRLLSKKNALNCISVFLNTKFEGGRHTKRIRKI
jgi:ribose 5-phosphate isomerase B